MRWQVGTKIRNNPPYPRWQVIRRDPFLPVVNLLGRRVHPGKGQIELGVGVKHQPIGANVLGQPCSVSVAQQQQPRAADAALQNDDVVEPRCDQEKARDELEARIVDAEEEEEQDGRKVAERDTGNDERQRPDPGIRGQPVQDEEAKEHRGEGAENRVLHAAAAQGQVEADADQRGQQHADERRSQQLVAQAKQNTDTAWRPRRGTTAKRVVHAGTEGDRHSFAGQDFSTLPPFG